jgi:hypothetical protein
VEPLSAPGANATVTGTFKSATVRTRVSPVPVLPPLRPLRPLQLVDGGFAMLRARPWQVMTIAAVFVIPTELLGAFLQRGSSASVIDALNDSSGDQNSGLALPLTVQLISSLALPFVAVAMARLVVADRLGTVTTTGEALRSVWPRSWALLAAWFLIHVVYALGSFCLLVPSVLMMGLTIVVAPVIALERLGPLAAIRRSQTLCRRRYWSCLGVALLSAAVTGALSLALKALPDVLGLFTLGHWGWLLAGVTNAAITLVTAPVVAATAVLLYLDLRVRTEGIDIEMDMTRCFGAQ